MGVIGIDVEDEVSEVREGDGGREVSGCASGRGKRKERNLKGSLDDSGGFRTLRYMLRERNARFACGT